MSLIRKLAGETIIYGGSTVFNRLLNYIIVTPYLTRVFAEEQEEYGIHGIMYAFAALLMVVLTYGMETAYFRFASKQEHREKSFGTASISLLFSTVVFVALILLCAEDIAGLLTFATDAPYVRYFALLIGFDVLAAIPFAKLRMDNRPIRFGLLKGINILVNGGFLLFFLELCPWLIEQGNSFAASIYDDDSKLHYIFLANLLASFVTFLLLLPIYFRAKLTFDRALWQQMFRYASPLIIVGIAGMINQVADRYLLKELLPGTTLENIRQVGIYTACVKIAVLMSLFTQAFKFAAEPFFFRHADRADAKNIYAQVGYAFAIVGSVAFLVVMLFLDVFQILIEESYREGLSIVPVLLLAYLFLGLYYNFSVWYKLTDKTHIGAYISVVGAVITLSLNVWLIPSLGYMGPAWAAFACFGTMTILSAIIGRQYYPIPYRFWNMLAVILLAVGIYSLAFWLRPEQKTQAYLLNVAWVAVYLILVYSLDRKFFGDLLKF
ncbi:MAG: oligosaccharide flippase family protein [Bacteroidota bacterium]